MAKRGRKRKAQIPVEDSGGIDVLDREDHEDLASEDVSNNLPSLEETDAPAPIKTKPVKVKSRKVREEKASWYLVGSLEETEDGIPNPVPFPTFHGVSFPTHEDFIKYDRDGRGTLNYRPGARIKMTDNLKEKVIKAIQSCVYRTKGSPLGQHDTRNRYIKSQHDIPAAKFVYMIPLAGNIDPSLAMAMDHNGNYHFEPMWDGEEEE